MTGKPVLHYFNGRGRMESIRWLLAAAGVEVRCPRVGLVFFLGYSLGAYLATSRRKLYVLFKQKGAFNKYSLNVGLLVSLFYEISAQSLWGPIIHIMFIKIV